MYSSIRNAGDGPAAATTARFYRSSDATLTTSDTLLVSREIGRTGVGAMNATGWVSFSAPTAIGIYYYGVCVDPVPTEKNTSNNCYRLSSSIPVPLPRPDLVVEAPAVDDSSLGTEASFTLSATVKNSGGWGSDSTTLRYYRSTDATITTSDTEAGTDEVQNLLSLGTSNESIQLTAPSTAGTYYYGACVDSVTGESDSTNNCSESVSVEVQ